MPWIFRVCASRAASWRIRCASNRSPPADWRGTPRGRSLASRFNAVDPSERSGVSLPEPRRAEPSAQRTPGPSPAGGPVQPTAVPHAGPRLRRREPAFSIERGVPSLRRLGKVRARAGAGPVPPLSAAVCRRRSGVMPRRQPRSAGLREGSAAPSFTVLPTKWPPPWLQHHRIRVRLPFAARFTALPRQMAAIPDQDAAGGQARRP